MNGDYNILDIDMMQKGIRKIIWQGWGWTEDKKRSFDEKKAIIQEAVNRQLAGFRIFIGNISIESRLLERLEYKIMHCIYHSDYPYCELPDKGMKLSPRRDDEVKITVKNNCKESLFGLPIAFEI